MVEAVEITDDGCLVCHKSDPSLRPLTTGSRVIIKFIQKQEGLFIKLTGSTVSSESDMVKIRIEETQCFQKKSTSPYTSFLQTLGVFTGNFKKVGQAV